MYLKKTKKSSLTRYTISVLKVLAFILFVFCFYQACKITTP